MVMRSFSLPQLDPGDIARLYAKLPLIAGIAAIGSAAVSLAYFVGSLRAVEVVQAEGSAAPAAVSADIQRAATAGWFGHAPGEDNAGGSSGGLALLGVSVASTPAMTGAYISVRGNPEMFYHPGEALGDGSVLEAVFNDHVTVRRGGALETIEFAAAPTMAVAAPAPSAGGVPMEPKRMASAPPPEKISDMNRAQVVQAFLNNAEDILKQVGLSPVEENSDLGYVYSGDDPQKILSAIGLQQGDVITGINDEPIGDTPNDRFRVSALVGQPVLSLHIRRAGKELVIEYKVP